MYIILTGCAQQGSFTNLSATIDGPSLIDMADMSAPHTGSIATFTTLIGALDATVIPANGTGSYTFSWTVTKTNENSDTGNRFSVASTGTTNGATYNTLTINGARPAVSGAGFDAEFEAVCVISDGVSPNVVIAVPFIVIAVAL
tara:strand:+ start:2363 stop:2794 length:432 start_codon:yes stop_codon:yes gene_type:complete